MVAPHLGPLGSLKALRYPARGYAPHWDLGTTVTKLLSGATVVERPAKAPRTFELDFNYLNDTERGTLRGLVLGWYGPPPFAYIDPSDVNVLEPNVASSGVTGASLSGWVAGGAGASVARSATGGSRGGGSIILTGASGGGVKTLDLGTRRFPVLPASVPVTCSIYAKVASGTLGTNLNINWFDAAGAYVSTTGASFTITTTATRYSNANAVPPGGAVTGQFELATSTTTAYVLTVDGAQAEYATAASTWLPGTPGMAWVAPIGWDPTVVAVGTYTGKLTLQEVP